MADMNLIPADIRLSLVRQRHLRRWSLALSAAGIALMVVLTIDWVDRANAGELRVQSGRIQSDQQAVRKELESVRAEANQVLLQIERAKALRAKRAWSGMFALIGSSMPDDCWLTSVATDPDRPRVVASNAPSAKAKSENESRGPVTIDAPRKLRIAGYAHDAAEPHAFVANLKETGVFLAVTLESSKVEPVLDGSYTRFELVCEW